MMRLLFTFIILLTLSNIKAQNGTQYEVIYEADQNGQAIMGNLQTLVNYVQNGNPARVGWVLKFKNPDPNSDEIIEMQHWADAGFITTLKGHVFAQISSIFQQGPAVGDPPGVFLVSNQPHGWVAIIGTTGVMKQKFAKDENLIKLMKDSGLTEEQINEELKKQETQNVITKWAVLVN